MRCTFVTGKLAHTFRRYRRDAIIGLRAYDHSKTILIVMGEDPEELLVVDGTTEQVAVKLESGADEI